MSKEFILKKNIFGGFDRRQVIEYIAHLQSQCVDNVTKDEIESTKKKIKDFLDAIEEKNRMIENLHKELNSLNSLDESDFNTDEVFNALNEADGIVESAKKEAKKYIVAAHQTVTNNAEKFSSMRAKLVALNDEITFIGQSADKISSKLDNVSLEKNADNEFAETYKNTATEPEVIENTGLTATIEEISVKNIESFADDNYSEEGYDKISLSDIIEDEDESVESPYNSIDNFFTELGKITGFSDFCDDNNSTQSVPEITAPSVALLSDENDVQADEVFEGFLKNIFHSDESDK